MEELLEGKTVAVDAAIWLYEAQVTDELFKHFGFIGAALKVVFERCARWLRKGVLPVIVLEGSGGGRAARTCSRGRGTLGPAFSAHTRVRALLAALGIPCVEADGEAEATCAALVAAGACDFVATTDFDALLFGAPRVLHSLDLRVAVASECELWEADAIERLAGLDRRALIAAAFLTGCDYDLRQMLPKLPWPPSQGSRQREQSSHSQEAGREGAGVRGMGPRQALRTARELRVAGDGDAVQALGDMLAGAPVDDTPASQIARSESKCHGCRRCGHGNVLKKIHGKKGCVECGSSSGCLPRREEGATCECGHCISVAAAGGKAKVQAARILVRAESRAGDEPGCSDGFTAVVQQYTRSADLASLLHRATFAWKGLDEAALQAALKGVFSSSSISSKLQPLQFEWALRVAAEECPQAARADLSKRRMWAASRGLDYVPLSAKSSKVGLDRAPHVLVEWALAHGEDASALKLSPAVRSARVNLARECGLLESDALRSSALAATFTRLLAECPAVVRQTKDSLLAWGGMHGVQLVPTGGRRLRSGRVHLSWSCVATARPVDEAKLVIERTQAEHFGGILASVGSLVSVMSVPGQRTLQHFFTVASKTDASSEDAITPSPATPPRRELNPLGSPGCVDEDSSQAAASHRATGSSRNIDENASASTPPRKRRRWVSNCLRSGYQFEGIAGGPSCSLAEKLTPKKHRRPAPKPLKGHFLKRLYMS